MYNTKGLAGTIIDAVGVCSHNGIFMPYSDENSGKDSGKNFVSEYLQAIYTTQVFAYLVTVNRFLICYYVQGYSEGEAYLLSAGTQLALALERWHGLFSSWDALPEVAYHCWIPFQRQSSF